MLKVLLVILRLRPTLRVRCTTKWVFCTGFVKWTHAKNPPDIDCLGKLCCWIIHSNLRLSIHELVQLKWMSQKAFIFGYLNNILCKNDTPFWPLKGCSFQAKAYLVCHLVRQRENTLNQITRQLLCFANWWCNFKNFLYQGRLCGFLFLHLNLGIDSGLLLMKSLFFRPGFFLVVFEEEEKRKRNKICFLELLCAWLY